MPTYKVILHETVQYEVIVEADDPDTAAEQAEKIWACSPTPTEDFNGTGFGVTTQYMIEG